VVTTRGICGGFWWFALIEFCLVRGLLGFALVRGESAIIELRIRRLGVRISSGALISSENAALAAATRPEYRWRAIEDQVMRDLETIDAELRLLTAVRWSIRTCEEGAPVYAVRPFPVELVGQRPLPKVGLTEPTVACCWMSCTQSW
jgi:hypothetical protein